MESNILLKIYNIVGNIPFQWIYILTLILIAPKEINVLLYLRKKYTLLKWEIIYNKALVDHHNLEIGFPTLNEIIKFPDRYHFEADETLVYCKTMTTKMENEQERSTNLKTWIYPKEKMGRSKFLLKMFKRLFYKFIPFT